MKGEYMYAQDVGDHTKFNEGYDKKENNSPNMQPVSARKLQEAGDQSFSKKKVTHAHLKVMNLPEMQEQLGKAENRCNTLKEQLDFMKKVCQTNSIDVFGRKKLKVVASNNENLFQDEMADKVSTKEEFLSKPAPTDIFEKPCFPVRQKSQAISTDKTGAAVNTINTILSGITESVNRLSELSVHMEERTPRPGSKRMEYDESTVTRKHSGDKPGRGGESRSKNKVMDEIIIESSAIVNISQGRKRSRHRNKGAKAPTQTISLSLNKKRSVRSTAKHSEKRLKLNTARTCSVADSTVDVKPAATAVRPPERRKPNHAHQIQNKNNNYLERNFYTENLIELYHNKAVNQQSDSEDSNSRPHDHPVKKFSVKAVPVYKDTAPGTATNLASPVNPMPQWQFEEMKGNSANYRDNRLAPIQYVKTDYQEGHYESIAEVPRSLCSYMRNYELPTIASKMKQVAKNYMKTFDFRAIPFCPAKSTSPSHNIGINIQQVMSIIKSRQPVSGISPTLAHNIGLAAEKLNSRPLTALVSSLGSKVTSMCPMMKNSINFSQMQELAKEIPDEVLQRMNVDNIMTGGAGDREITNSSWTVDPSTKKSCTCYSAQGVGFQQVLNRYNGSQITSPRPNPSQLHYKINTSKVRLPKYLQRTTGIRRKDRVNAQGDEASKREKSLKEVIKNLHDDFEFLNSKYEDLQRRINEGGEPADSMKELERMDKELSHKEEEITMVMTLYKEVTSLKEQVKSLKQRASQCNIPQQPQMQMSPQFVHPQMAPMMNQQQPTYGNPNPAVSKFQVRSQPGYSSDKATLQLTKLLRQIRSYQGSFKKEGRS